MSDAMPCKRLLMKRDLDLWESSETRAHLVHFIEQLADAVRGRENEQYDLPISASVEALMGLLQQVRGVIERHPVAKKDAPASRFGKVEFRDFYDELRAESASLITGAFPQLTQNQVRQLQTYLEESWGDKRRIDYGSGHELNFMCFLYGLTAYKVFDLGGTDRANLVLKPFIEYLKIMRVLETEYWLEPAGSHGVWGLDDYHFLPFLFGAFQLSTHKHLKPLSIHNEEVVELFADKYLYFGCIHFINSVKTTATLRWHSPMLDDISGVKKWSKVAEGMVKMYQAEVLSKLPIMQHFYFSDFLLCPEGVSAPDNVDRDDDGCSTLEPHMGHATWGDCCGIKIPSAIAATESNRQTNRHKPLPFD
ncbi:peptidylprolyl isomerase RRD2 KNAG_0J01690 [Huiozyma naganishii CBS 8797]|uniref:Serine/threonine-protein phosphatase 2A activator n=1 Tax=Huiozyma naganishii (strain ATCC MYA-139 / BCRC 22969 / CBS 8797 / KCTC 17520 / NBRC 10181 / NCYC 3082 / Yp74L-3) TaxID=1071383 RepID=J7RBJ3_HUIN7|nr:hypothetical protein KNAG_0J01690 [Kazachstania naganishii CBS 8797]CCK72250.1 hypothetical protein KNAG_0J01690 [Kazachstania naganishii CBS 8797]